MGRGRGKFYLCSVENTTKTNAFTVNRKGKQNCYVLKKKNDNLIVTYNRISKGKVQSGLISWSLK